VAKLPKYINLEFKERKAFIHLKTWGIPILMFQAMVKMEGLKWYHWLLYPKICVKAMRGGLNEH
jgi:hypothetical protein